MTSLQKPTYRSDIDGLRGLAVTCVVVYHLFPKLLPGGFIGVDIFFVISGFLITSIILSGLRSGNFSFADFYLKRARRLFPALLVVMICCYGIGWFFLLCDEFRDLGKQIAAGAGFASNLLFWKESGYFDAARTTKPLLQLWSLGIEEQFYLVWPLLLWGAYRLRIRFLPLIVLTCLVSLGVSIWDTQTSLAAAFFSPASRLWELAFGGVLALVNNRIVNNSSPHLHPQELSRSKNQAANIASLAGLALIALALSTTKEHSTFPGLLALLPVTGALLVLLGGPTAWLNRAVLSSSPMVGLGLISYPLYLWHWSLFSFTTIIQSAQPELPTRIALLVTSVILAGATYRYVEKPARAAPLTSRYARLLVASMFAVGLIGFETYRHDGFLFRKIDPDARYSIPFRWPPRIDNKKCLALTHLPRPAYCILPTQHTPSVALIGDSHARMLFDYFEHYFGAKGRGVVLLGKGGCTPLLGVRQKAKNCPETLDAVLDYLKQTPEISDVFVAGWFSELATAGQVENPNAPRYLKLLRNGSITDPQEIFFAGLEGLLSELSASGKRVAIVLDLPQLAFHPKSCLAFRGARRCESDKNTVLDRQKGYRHIIESLRMKHRFRTIDLAATFCNDEKCLAEYRGKILYRDNHHLNQFAVDFLVDRRQPLD